MNVKAIVLHHTGTSIGSVGDGSDIARSIENTVKVKYNGQYKSSYHLLVGPTGKVFEGQPLGTVAPHCGIDAGDYYQDPSGVNNQNSLAICAIGNFQGEGNYMPEAQSQAIGLSIKRLRETYQNKPFIKLHRELVNTSCPGINYPYAKIFNIALESKKMKKVTMTVRVQGPNKYIIEMSDGKKIPITDRGDHSVVIGDKIWVTMTSMVQAMRPGSKTTWDGINKIATVEWEE